MFRPEFSIASSLLIVGGLWALSGSRAIAQSNIVPDQSLEAESSQVIPNAGGSQNELIQGGAKRGANLFHSFREFNIEAGRGAFFANPVGVENILSRVTGRNLSDIDGTLGVLGDANFFLINPNGIMFGPQARLDLSGSFLASTAGKITFPDGRDFDAQVSQQPAVLSIKVPQGLQWGNQSAPVTVQGSILSVQAGQSLALLGGDVRIGNGALGASGGRVDLIGVAADGVIEFDHQDGFAISEDVAKADVTLTNTFVDVASDIGGGISINAENVEILEGSELFSGSEGVVEAQSGDISLNATDEILVSQASTINNISFEQVNTGSIELEARSIIFQGGSGLSNVTFGAGDTGVVTIHASESVLFEGINLLLLNDAASFVVNQVAPGAQGNANDIEIKTKSLVLRDGAQLSTNTFGIGDTGNLKLRASESILLEGEDNTGIPSTVGSQVAPGAQGNANDIEIITKSLTLKDGARLSAGIFGMGNGGSIKLHASESILLEGENSQGNLISGISSQVASGAQGNAGKVDIVTKFLILRGGAQLSVATLGIGDAGTTKIQASESVIIEGQSRQGLRSLVVSGVAPRATGNAGGINIETRSLILNDGAQLIASTLGKGDAGEISIDANTLSLNNGSQIESATTRDGLAGDIVIRVQDNITLIGEDSGIFANTIEGSTGNGGSIFIDPVSVIIKDGAQIAVDSQGIGQGGDIGLLAGSLTLDQGTISAETASNLGGDIELDIDNLLLLRNNSLISATAGTSQAGGDGGNIDIDTVLLVAFPFENSDITANAFEGTGGNIQITAQGVFGTAFRDQLTPSSDITASSNFGTDGTVQLDTSLDPTSGLVDLPVQPPQPQQVAQTCAPGGSSAQSEFVYTGRGGLPPTAQQVLNQPEIEADWVSLAPHTDRENQSQSQPRKIPENKVPAPNLLSQELSADALILSKTTERGLSDDALSLSKEAERGLSEVEAPSPQIVEAQGWMSTNDGKVILTSSTTTAPHHLAQKVCPSS